MTKGKICTADLPINMASLISVDVEPVHRLSIVSAPLVIANASSTTPSPEDQTYNYVQLINKFAYFELLMPFGM